MHEQDPNIDPDIDPNVPEALDQDETQPNTPVLQPDDAGQGALDAEDEALPFLAAPGSADRLAPATPAGASYDPPKLHKVLADAGVGSRREMEELILAGRVSVNGTPAHIGQRIVHSDQVKVNGKPIRIQVEPPPVRVLAYHKPAGEIVTKSDPQQRVTVFRQLPPVKFGRWITVGRLDVSTEGLLLFTTSGELANRLMHPRSEIEREYAVRVFGELSPEALQQMRDGVVLDDGPAHFDNIMEAGGEGANRWWRVTLKEGRNREVRRIFDAVGVTVSRLIRIRYGMVALPPGLKRGQSADLSAESVTELMASVGLKQRQAGRPGSRGKQGGRAGARTKPEARPPRGNRAPKAFEGPMSSESRAAIDPHDRALDAEEYDQQGHDDEWQPSGPDAHLSHLAGKPKKNQGARKPNPLQTTWGTSKQPNGVLSAPQRAGGGGGRPSGSGPRPADPGGRPGGRRGAGRKKPGSPGV
ncbi:RsuA 16S rRNA uridine-516 pseudouridylate synthase and related pseudouridylate synthases [Burkholderiales bacterium]